MELNIFSPIDEIVKYYSETRDSYIPIAEEIKKAIEDTVIKNSMYTLTVNYRIKEAASLREKMIKNSSYRKYETKEETLASFRDIIGVRIDCKFMEDESYVYDVVKTVFNKTTDYIYFYNESVPSITLKLCESQPQKQKNGFDIYKIEGIYKAKESQINFELQIKSLVNTFWGDIEHKIIYKNNSYIVMDDLVLDNMTSIKENLNLIDKQLHQLYGRYKREDTSNRRMRFKNIDAIMSKMLHDAFANKMSVNLGFVTDFKEICDSIVKYMLIINNADSMESYGKVMLDTFYVSSNISKNELAFDKYITIDRDLNFGNDGFCDSIAKTILELINCDFQWHIFFLILFNVQRGNKADVLENFIRYYKSLFVANSSFGLLHSIYDHELVSEIKTDLIEELGFIFKRNSDVKYLCKKGTAILNSALSRVIEDISLKGDQKLDWPVRKGIFLSKLNEYANK